MAGAPDQLGIFTIGHSNHPLGTFLWLLRKHGIQALVDIRSYPGSKRHPHFRRDNLSASLAEEDIEYHWLEALGGHRKRNKNDPPSKNRGVEDEGFRIYADYMASDGFQQGVTRLMEIAGSLLPAIMCAEGDYRHCHRQFLSDYLVVNGVHVQHILPTGETKPHKLSPRAKVTDGIVTYPGQPTLFAMDEEPPTGSDQKQAMDFKSLLESLASQLDAATSGQPSESLKFNCFSIVAEYGREFTPAPKPKNIQWGDDNDCYGNAFRLMDDDLTYCEGYAVPDLGSVVHEMDHAWCVDADGTVIDNTWRKPGLAYFGIPFTQQFVRQQLLATGWSSILEGDLDLFRGGLPSGAVKEI